MNSILNAVWQRMVDNRGAWTTDSLCKAIIPLSATEIGSRSGKIDLKPCIVPTYLAIMPFDPSGGLEVSTGYTIIKSSTGRITISAPKAELGESISVTR